MAIKYFQNMLNTLKNSVITSWPANVEKGVLTPFTVTGLSKTLDVIIVYASTIKCLRNVDYNHSFWSEPER